MDMLLSGVREAQLEPAIVDALERHPVVGAVEPGMRFSRSAIIGRLFLYTRLMLLAPLWIFSTVPLERPFFYLGVSRIVLCASNNLQNFLKKRLATQC